jgi:hypothetical protein
METLTPITIETSDWFFESDLMKFMPSTTGFEPYSDGFEIMDSAYIKNEYLIQVYIGFKVKGLNGDLLFKAEAIGSQKFKMNKGELPTDKFCFEAITQTRKLFYRDIKESAINNKSLIQQLPEVYPDFEDLKSHIQLSISEWVNMNNNIGLN